MGSILYFLAKHRIESRTRSSLNPLLPNKPPIAFIAEKQQESRFYTTIEMNLNKARGKSTRKKEDIASQITIDGTYYSLETDSRMSFQKSAFREDLPHPLLCIASPKTIVSDREPCISLQSFATTAYPSNRSQQSSLSSQQESLFCLMTWKYYNHIRYFCQRVIQTRTTISPNNDLSDDGVNSLHLTNP